MNREKAIEAMDLLTGQGYTVVVTAVPMLDHIGPGIEDGMKYTLQVPALHYDKVDLRHLCDQAEALGLEVIVGGITQGTVEFVVQEFLGNEALRSQRRHPR